MLFTPEIVSAFETIINAAENDFEMHRIKVLLRDLTAPPTVEIIDGTHQKFNGVEYFVSKKGHFKNNTFLHRAVYEYYCGEIPEGYVIHHIDRDKFNNSVENLQLVTPQEHTEIHRHDRMEARKRKEFVCEVCGKTFLAYDIGVNRYCSKTCQKKARNVLPDRMVEVTCAVCGKTFLRRKDKKTKTCSPKCTAALRLKNYVPVSQTVERTCVICGKKFTCSKFKPTRTCSRKCGQKLSWMKRIENST